MTWVEATSVTVNDTTNKRDEALFINEINELKGMTQEKGDMIARQEEFNKALLQRLDTQNS